MAIAGQKCFTQRKARKKPGLGWAFFSVSCKNQVPRVCVAFTAIPQNVPETVAVCVAGSYDDVMSTSHTPEPPTRAQLKLPLWVCVWSPDSAALTMFR